jgi:hypothetical protein
MMSGVWEEGCEKEGMMMVKVGDLGNREEASKMKVGGHDIMNQLAFQRVVKSTFVGKWRQDLPSSDNCGSTREGVHEHGEWQTAGGGQEKVNFGSKRVKNRKGEEVGVCWVWDLRVSKQWSTLLQKQKNKI